MDGIHRRLGALVTVVAVTVLVGAVLVAPSEPEEPKGPRQSEGPVASVATLQSRSDLRPPEVAVDDAPRRPADDRLIFLSPRMEQPERDAATRQQGALALDQLGRTVWFRRAPDGKPVTDVRVQRYRGEPVLTWWQGSATKQGIGRGHAVIVDQSYRVIARVRAGNGQTLDLHEFLLTPRGTALTTIYSRARADLTALGGKKDALVTEGVIQEIDVESGKVLFEWHSLDHVDPSESYRPLPEKPGDSYDYFHINSVAEDEDGDLMVSARSTSGVYKIDKQTGNVRWRLGGKKSDFKMRKGAEFGLQHDARFLGDDLVQIFDNANEDKTDQTPSSVKRIKLDTRRKTATLVERFAQPDGMWAETQGNAQPLAGGGVLAGWGSTGAVTWFDARGRVLFDVHLPAEYDSYRAYLAHWTGRPASKPAIHAARDDRQVTVWASWNGSTDVRRWQVLAGPRPDELRPVGAPARWSNLETTIVRETEEPYVAAAALDADGRTLATSPAIEP